MVFNVSFFEDFDLGMQKFKLILSDRLGESEKYDFSLTLFTTPPPPFVPDIVELTPEGTRL